MPSSKIILPYLALALGIISLGFSALFVRWANAPGPVMAVYRIGIASLILAPAFFVHMQRNKYQRRQMFSLALIFPVMGGVFTAFDHAFWNTAILHTTAANATLLGNTAPLWVALAAWLVFRERLVRLFWIGLSLALVGAATVMGNDFLLHPSLGWGDILALLAGVFYAGYFLVTQRGREHMDTLSYVWLVNISSTLALLIMSFTLKLPLTGYPLQTYLAFLGAAIVAQIFGYLSVAYALGHLPASMVAPTLIGQPVVTALLAIPFLGENLQTYQWVGGITVLAGIYLVHKSRERALSEKEI